MPAPIPLLKLTYTQLLWVLSRGQGATPKLEYDLRYLRQLGVPFADGKRGQGRGTSVYYGFDDLVECGLAIHAIRRRMRAGEVAALILKHRKDWRRLYRELWLKQPDDVLEQAWLEAPMPPARIDTIWELPLPLVEDGHRGAVLVRDLALQELRAGNTLGDQVALLPEGNTCLVVPLGRLVISLVFWAYRAPVKRRGRPVIRTEDSTSTHQGESHGPPPAARRKARGR